MQVKIKRMSNDIPLPVYKHEGDSGMDFCNSGSEIVIQPLKRAIIPTGIKVAVPLGYELQIRPRSGLALKKGVTVLNTPGTIDAGYRGEVQIIIYNSNADEAVTIQNGERVAQAVLNKIEHIEWRECEQLDETTRSEGGFGSTGLNFKED